MGHNQVPAPPSGVRWKGVNTLLADGAPAAKVAAAAYMATRRQWQAAMADPVHAEAVRLLAGMPQATRVADFAAALQSLGLSATPRPDATALIFAVGDRLDQVAREQRGGDFGELARRALTGTLSSWLQAMTSVAGAETRPAAFPALVRRFYQRLLSEGLSSFLDRSLADHVGPGKRFAHAGEVAGFGDAITRHCFETTEVIEEFARGWHARRVRVGDEVATVDAAGFGTFALQTIFAEWEQGR